MAGHAPESSLAWTGSVSVYWAIGSVGDGVYEVRIDYGPGYRVYGQDGDVLILLLSGGDKRTQRKDIEKAHGYWKDYKARKPAVPSGGPFKKPG
jgi:hypothetical protein